MTKPFRALVLTIAFASLAVAAGAQTSSTQSSQQSAQTTDAYRPATTTFFGDTGLWFVPTAEVLAKGKWSASAYRRGSNYVQGYSNIGDIAGTFAFGLGDRAEIFTSFLFDTRVERDLRPIFTTDQERGGILDRYPKMNTGWTGNRVGDLYIGGKFNLASEWKQKPVALAVRVIVKAPTGDADVGASTGKTDTAFDFIASKELARGIDFSSYVGYEFWGKPDNLDTSSGAFRYGAGVGLASRKPLRVELEYTGIAASKGTAVQTGAPLVGFDGSVSPLTSSNQDLQRATAAITWQHRNGFFIGGGVSWNFSM